MSDLAASIVPAVAALTGVVVTGFFALWTQRAARKAEQARWDREARTRFHESRLQAYTEFLEQASNAMGYMLHQVIQRQVNPEEAAIAAAANAAGAIPRTEHPEFNHDAPRQMLRRQNVVMMLASSSEIRDAATALVSSVMAVATELGEDPSFGRLNEILARKQAAEDRFIAAVGTELTS